MHIQPELFNQEEIQDRISKTNINIEFDIQNRKYIGSKFRLVDFILKVILSKVKEINTFIDGFSGTGIIAYTFADYVKKIISNDLLYSNYIVNKAFLNSSSDNVDLNRVSWLLNDLNRSDPLKGYVYKNFGGTYFSYENAGLIDAIREKIEDLFNQNKCTLQEKYILLTSLLYAIDKVANTIGQYDAFLKHLGKESYNENGNHVIDSNVYKRILLKLPKIKYCVKGIVYNEDLNALIKKIKGDVLYLDPPYNNRQYIDNYHVLENIIKWEEPQLYGKTKKFKRDNLMSKYSKKNEAINVFRDLIKNADVKHIFLSYNNEGIMPEETIVKILKKAGTVEIFKQDYKIFGNGAGVSKKRKIEEIIYYCKIAK